MKLLLTGSAGFIGSHLQELLESKGVEIVDYDVKQNSAEDVRDFNNVSLRAKGVDGIVHLAAMSRVKWGFEDPRKCVEVNVNGVANVLEASRVMGQSGKSPWVIFASSREVFGEPKVMPVTEESPKIAVNVYGITKAIGEDLCKAYVDNYSLRTRVLRFSNVYSSPLDQLDRVTPKFIIQAAKNEPITINGTGEEVFDFTYIDDTADGIYKCIQEIERNIGTSFGDFNLVTGKATTLLKLAHVVIEKMNSKSPIIFNEGRQYDVNKFYGDPQKAMRVLGYRPAVDLETGISMVIKRFKSAGII